MKHSVRRWTMRGRALTRITCTLWLAGLSSPGVVDTPAFAQAAFEQYEVVIGSANRQTVLTGFLLGGAIAELAIVDIDENKGRRLHIYTFEGGTWVPRLDATLRPEVLFVDVASIGGRDRLVTSLAA